MVTAGEGEHMREAISTPERESNKRFSAVMVLTYEVEEGVSRAHRSLPDLDICHTGEMGRFRSFPACLVEGPDACPYVMRTGLVEFCTHPHWEDFSR